MDHMSYSEISDIRPDQNGSNNFTYISKDVDIKQPSERGVKNHQMLYNIAPWW